MNDESRILAKWVPFEDSDPDETYLACPICGDPADYCQDHHHWCCPECYEPLEIEHDNDIDDHFWTCINIDCDE